VHEDGIRSALERIETKLDILVGRVEDHEFRVRGLERLKYIATGVWMVLGAVVAWLAQVAQRYTPKG